MVLSSDVQFQGRWDLEGENRYITRWCGSSLRFQTASRSVTLQLGGLTASRKNYHNVLWRFGSQSVTRTALVKGKRTMVLTPSGIGAGSSNGGEVPRNVTIMLCDWGATLQILDIEAEDDIPILPPQSELPLRPLLFIGDSLISGFSPPSRGLVLPHGCFQTFGSITTHSLRALGHDARLEMVASAGAISGTQIDELDMQLTKQMLDMGLLTSGHDIGMRDMFWDGLDGIGGWEHRSRDPPHDIFVCIGTIDKESGFRKDEFIQNYEAFLIRLRESYPQQLKRIHVISPFGNFKDAPEPGKCVLVFEPDVQRMVEALAQSWHESDPDGVKLYHVDTNDWIDNSLTCDGQHPTVEGHETISAKLVKYLGAHGLA